MNESRQLKVSFNKSGSGSISSSVRLPISWLKEMGISKEDREVEVIFNNEEIIIKKLDK